MRSVVNYLLVLLKGEGVLVIKTTKSRQTFLAQNSREQRKNILNVNIKSSLKGYEKKTPR